MGHCTNAHGFEEGSENIQIMGINIRYTNLILQIIVTQ